jgi:hypothetical protein
MSDDLSMSAVTSFISALFFFFQSLLIRQYNSSFLLVYLTWSYSRHITYFLCRQLSLSRTQSLGSFSYLFFSSLLYANTNSFLHPATFTLAHMAAHTSFSFSSYPTCTYAFPLHSSSRAHFLSLCRHLGSFLLSLWHPTEAQRPAETSVGRARTRAEAGTAVHSENRRGVQPAERAGRDTRRRRGRTSPGHLALPCRQGLGAGMPAWARRR